MADSKESSTLERLRSTAKQQKGKLYIIKICIAMLICGSPKYDLHAYGKTHSTKVLVSEAKMYIDYICIALN
ncbi:hypothetical protein ABZP36_013968 [Zizania latifolia]